MILVSLILLTVLIYETKCINSPNYKAMTSLRPNMCGCVDKKASGFVMALGF